MRTNPYTGQQELDYKDFKIGQKVICTSVSDFLADQHLTIGKEYIIEDLDFHFFDKICVKSDNGKTSMFVEISFFDDGSELKRISRKKKLERIVNE